eukprot:COSAG01_NODE_27908_length_674_cov_0.624348_3_plen_84_part_01
MLKLHMVTRSRAQLHICARSVVAPETRRQLTLASTRVGLEECGRCHQTQHTVTQKLEPFPLLLLSLLFAATAAATAAHRASDLA